MTCHHVFSFTENDIFTENNIRFSIVFRFSIDFRFSIVFHMCDDTRAMYFLCEIYISELMVFHMCKSMVSENI